MFQAVLPELVQLGPDHIAELTLAYIQQQQKTDLDHHHWSSRIRSDLKS